METTPIPDSAFYRRMAQGHAMRHGHALTGYLASDDGAIYKLIRTCCDDEAPSASPALPDDYADEFVSGYIECALWSESAGITVADDGTVREAPDDDTSFQSHNFDASDIGEEAQASMRADCEAFIASNTADLATVANMRGDRAEWSAGSLAGHDFWLTRNGHGAGFWDRGYGAVGERLSDASRPYGEAHLYAYVPDGTNHASPDGHDVTSVRVGIE